MYADSARGERRRHYSGRSGGVLTRNTTQRSRPAPAVSGQVYLLLLPSTRPDHIARSFVPSHGSWDSVSGSRCVRCIERTMSTSVDRCIGTASEATAARAPDSESLVRWLQVYVASRATARKSCTCTCARAIEPSWLFSVLFERGTPPRQSVVNRARARERGGGVCGASGWNLPAKLGIEHPLRLVREQPVMC